MAFIQNNIVAILVALVAGAAAWVWGGTRSSYLLMVMPWVWALLLEGMFFFPQRREGETTPAARRRVGHDFFRDPLTWAVLIFLALLAVPFVNTALCPVCDKAALAAGADSGPFFKFLPFCTNRYEHLNVFLWFGPTLTAVLAIRHSLSKEGQRHVLLLIVLNAALLALFGFLESSTGALAPFWAKRTRYASVFFSTFGYANMAADYFMATTILALALWRNWLDEHPENHHEKERRTFWQSVVHLVARHWLLLLACLLISATFSTLSRAGILLVSAGVAILLVHAIMSYFARLNRLGRVRASAFFLLAFSLLAVFVMTFVPTGVTRELGTVSAKEALNRVAGRGEYHTDVALALLKEHPAFGCGGWGYRHYSVPLLPKGVRDDLKYEWSRGGANVHNDCLQFLVEHGIIGFAILVFIVVLLLEPVGTAWRRLALAARFKMHGQGRHLPHPVSLFALPASAFSVLVAVGATLIHSFGDCPLRSAAVLSLFFIELASIDGFLPHFDDADESDNNEE